VRYQNKELGCVGVG